LRADLFDLFEESVMLGHELRVPGATNPELIELRRSIASSVNLERLCQTNEAANAVRNLGPKLQHGNRLAFDDRV